MRNKYEHQFIIKYNWESIGNAFFIKILSNVKIIKRSLFVEECRKQSEKESLKFTISNHTIFLNK